MKNQTTPRTLSDCEFVTGYQVAYTNKPGAMYRLVRTIAGLALFALIGVILAWRM
jgi:hypothetical protein